MKNKWFTALSSTVALTLMVGSIPAFANDETAIHTGANELGLRYKDHQLHLYSTLRATKSSQLVILQLTGPVEESWKEELNTLGVTLGDYVPDYSFVAKLSEDTDQSQLLQLPYVRQLHPFQAGYKISPDLMQTIKKKGKAKVTIYGLQTENGNRSVEKRTVTDREIIDLLQSDDVVAIQPVTKRVPLNNVASGIIKSDKLASTGYTGKKQVVGVIDTGLDTGDEADIHPDLRGQIKSMWGIGREDDPSDPDGHGTHVAGSIAGTGKASNGSVKGLAPDAKLVFHSVLDDEGGLAIDEENLPEMLQDAYDEGARIHNNSWGEDQGTGEYGYDAEMMDQFMWEHKDMLILVAAGNDGELSDEGSVGSPATAKNVLAVGASESVRPELDDPEADDADEIAIFSSRGPTVDGRIKPEIVSPGSMILSLRSQVAEEFESWEDQESDDYYTYMSGTSMATPVLAGGVAQIRQYLTEKGQKQPSAALMKAMLIAGTDDLDVPTKDQGFGRANLVSAIGTSFVDQQKDGLSTGKSATYTVKVTDASKPFVTALTWTDFPGSVVSMEQLVNDLNLTIESPSGEIFNGNDTEAPFDDERDDLNNVEKVVIDKPEKGTYTITVEGFDIPQGPQPYALASNVKIAGGSDGADLGEVKEETVTGSVNASKASEKKVEYKLSVTQPGEVTLNLGWDGKANLDLYLVEGKKTIAKSTDKKANPEKLSFQVKKAGTYIVRVQAASGKADYTLTMSYPVKKANKKKR